MVLLIFGGLKIASKLCRRKVKMLVHILLIILFLPISYSFHASSPSHSSCAVMKARREGSLLAMKDSIQSLRDELEKEFDKKFDRREKEFDKKFADLQRNHTNLQEEVSSIKAIVIPLAEDYITFVVAHTILFVINVEPRYFNESDYYDKLYNNTAIKKHSEKLGAIREDFAERCNEAIVDRNILAHPSNKQVLDKRIKKALGMIASNPSLKATLRFECTFLDAWYSDLRPFVPNKHKHAIHRNFKQRDSGTQH